MALVKTASYTPATATAGRAGVVRIGEGVSVAGDGTISVQTGVRVRVKRVGLDPDTDFGGSANRNVTVDLGAPGALIVAGPDLAGGTRLPLSTFIASQPMILSHSELSSIPDGSVQVSCKTTPKDTLKLMFCIIEGADES